MSIIRTCSCRCNRSRPTNNHCRHERQRQPTPQLQAVCQHTVQPRAHNRPRRERAGKRARRHARSKVKIGNEAGVAREAKAPTTSFSIPMETKPMEKPRRHRLQRPAPEGHAPLLPSSLPFWPAKPIWRRGWSCATDLHGRIVTALV